VKLIIVTLPYSFRGHYLGHQKCAFEAIEASIPYENNIKKADIFISDNAYPRL